MWGRKALIVNKCLSYSLSDVLGCQIHHLLIHCPLLITLHDCFLGDTNNRSRYFSVISVCSLFISDSVSPILIISLSKASSLPLYHTSLSLPLSRAVSPSQAQSLRLYLPNFLTWALSQASSLPLYRYHRSFLSLYWPVPFYLRLWHCSCIYPSVYFRFIPCASIYPSISLSQAQSLLLYLPVFLSQTLSLLLYQSVSQGPSLLLKLPVSPYLYFRLHQALYWLTFLS